MITILIFRFLLVLKLYCSRTYIVYFDSCVRNLRIYM